MVDKLVGDTVMAVFRDDAHLDRALDACIAVHRRVGDMAARTGASFPYAGRVAVGLDSGHILYGTVGSRVVSRLDYMALGAAVDCAAQLQQSPLALGRILVGAAVERRVRQDFETVQIERDPGDEGPAVFEVVRRLSDIGPSSSAETILVEPADVSELHRAGVNRTNP